MEDRGLNVREYVISHIDEAIEKGWIHVYYQPVVRSLTGQLCGAESLARWIDDVIGFLDPIDFISALEESGNIPKLDCHVVEVVCRDIHDLIESGKHAFPVSVNFSRLDFVTCDMVKVVEDAVEKYDIPRDYIHIEITESMIAKDEEMMKEVIENFRSRGYEIWMDDFGSGYSSLTLLKDYQFDLLKMDMRFLSSMTDKAKIIVRSTIIMAKSIGIRTLTEGVETQEQVEFLKKIGCGKLQGFYFGRATPLDEMLANLESKGITIEERQWRNYYEMASVNTKDTEAPLEIIEFDGKNFKTLFMNAAYRQQIMIQTKDLELIDNVCYNPSSPLYTKYIQFMERAIKSKNKESYYYTDRGNYFNFKIRYLAENQGRYLFKATISNISLDQNTQERDRLDLRLRELNNLHEVVLLLNIANNTVSPLIGGYRYLDVDGRLFSKLEESIKYFSREYIYYDEMDKFLDFLDTSTLRKREEESGRGFICELFRVKQKDGCYRWRMITILSVPGTDGTEYMCTISVVAKEMVKLLDEYTYADYSGKTEGSEDRTSEYARIWDNIIKSSHSKYFWKDKERRFRGVSRAFLDFYEIKSLDDIIGKTDEDMHWHLDDVPYKDDELDVINKGAVVFNARGQCIVNGVVHNIICNKMPLYDKGEIVGLIGSFDDVDQELYRVQKLVNPSRVDNVTRLMNNRFFLEAMVDYAAQYNDAGRNYGIIIIHNSNHKRIVTDYGEKFANKVLREMGEKIIECIGQTAAAARNKEAYFGVIIYIKTREELIELGEKIKAAVLEIHEVDSKSVTLRVSMGVSHRSDEGIKDETMYQVALEEVERIEKEEKHKKG